jgi:Lamin Tail Domain/Bacterial Ig domain/Secretion system C-terminal sorting domain
MKKCLLSLLMTFAVGLSVQAQVVISEIMYNPPESGTDTLEYIEIFNTTNASINLAGWSLFGVDLTFPAGTNLAAGAYLVTAKSSNAIQVIFNKPSIQWTSGALSNSGEALKLLNASGALIDSVTYGNAAPWPTGAAGNGNSLVLCDANADNSLPSSWSDATTLTTAVINGKQVFANPAAASGCVTGLVAQPDIADLVPGQPSTIDVLANDNLPSPVTALTILTPPTNGTATVSGNSIVYTPAANFCGSDALTYQVCDGPASCASATVAINVKCYPARTIAQVTTENAQGLADSSGISCQLTGTVYGVNFRASGGGTQFVIMDQTGANGITLFRNTGTFGYDVQESDQVTVRGTITQFNGLTQMNLDTIIKTGTNNPTVAPSVVIVLGENTENRLVRFNNMRWVDAAAWVPAGSGFNMRMYSPDNVADTITLRIDNDVELFLSTTAPSEPFDVIGLGGQFDSSLPYTSGYQLLPRYGTDIFPTVSTYEADFSAYVRLSPNPTSGALDVRTTEAFDRIVVYNGMGQLIFAQANPTQEERFDLSGLATGMYLLRFEKDGAFWTTRVVKQ